MYVNGSTNPDATKFGDIEVARSMSASSGVTGQSVTASSELIGYPIGLGSTTPLNGTSAIGTATAVPERGFTLVTVANTSLPYLKLGTPKLGAEVELYAVVTATCAAKTILISTDGSITIGSTFNAVTLGNSSDFICLKGMTATKWMVKSLGGTATLTTG